MLRKDRPLVSVVGAGYWGQNLVRNFYRLGALKSVYDEDRSTAEKMAAEHPGLKVAASWEEVLADGEVGGVILATPAATHYPLARQALMAGKNVMVEKPLTLSTATGRDLVELAQTRGLVLMVDHILQNHPAYLKLRELVGAGELGRLRRIHSRRLSWGKVRQEENVLWSFAPHDISMILGLTGERPDAAWACGDGWITPGVADAVEGRLTFPGGVTAQLSVGWLNPVKEQRLVVVGDRQSAVFDDTRPWPEKLTLYDHRLDWPGQKPLAVKGQARPVEVTEAEPLAAQCRDFIEAMEGKKIPLSDGREGLGVLAVLEMMEKSMAQGGRPISLNLDQPEYFAHPTAVIDQDTEIGAGTKIWHFCHVMEGTVIGPNSSLGQNVVAGPRVKIGSGVKIQNNVSVYEGVTLEDDVFCGPSMVFTNVINPRACVVRKHEYLATVVRQGATIGANATIVCGHTLGAWCFIAAGAVVTRDVPDHALMVGAPAVRRGWMCRCGVKLHNLTCPSCRLKYRETDTGLVTCS